MSRLETVSKRAAIASTLAITALQLALHPDTTPGLQLAGAAALAAGWVGARRGIHALWLLLAPLAPALLLIATGRQGPVIEIWWMAGLTGSLLGSVSWSGWMLPPWSRLLLGGWALTLAVAWPVFVLREGGFDLSALRDASAINSWAMLTARDVIAWTLYAVQVQLVALLWFEWIYGVFAAAVQFPDSDSPRSRKTTEAPVTAATSRHGPIGSSELRSWELKENRPPVVAHAMWIGVTLASAVALVQGTIDLSFLNTEFWVEQRRAAGTMLDANAYGVAAAIAGPVGFLALRGAPRFATAAGVLVLAVNWSGVWMSSSRTGLACALFGAAGLGAGVWRAHNPRRRLLALASAAAVVAVAIVFAGTIGPVQRLTGVTLDRQTLRQAWARGGYGTISTEMIREYPLTGVGAGAFRYLAPDYWRVEADDQLPLDNAQNWWRHQLAELGLLGGALVLTWSALVAWQVLAARSRPPHRISPWTVRALVAGIGFCSLVGMPTQSPVVLLWFFFLLAWMTVLVTPTVPAPSARTSRAVGVAALFCAAAYTAGHFVLAAGPSTRLGASTRLGTAPAWLGAGPLDVAARAQRFHREHVEGAYALEDTAEGVPFRWTDDKARFLLPATTRWLVIRLWAHHPDIEEEPVKVLIAAPCGTAFEQELRSTTPVSIGLALPSTAETVDATVHVSRTWTPADTGAADTRRLGVGILTEFVPDEELGRAQDFVVEWPDCPAG